MFEMHNGLAQIRHCGDYVLPAEHTNVLRAEGLTPREITRLMSAQNQTECGQLDQETNEYTRFRFALWPYQHSQIKS
jgi:hypothetical protein